MFLFALIVSVAFALLLWTGYSAGRFKYVVVNFKKFPVKWQARTGGLIGITLVPAIVVLWIVCPELSNVATWLLITQLLFDLVYITIMGGLSMYYTQMGTLLEQLHGIYATKTSNPLELQRQLQNGYSKKYSLKRIEKALQIMSDTDVETQQIPIYYNPNAGDKNSKPDK